MIKNSKKYKKGRQIFFQVILIGVLSWLFNTIMDSEKSMKEGKSLTEEKSIDGIY